MTAIQQSKGTLKSADIVTQVLGIWLVIASFGDGWTHVNRPAPETFFTPWHAVLYSGLVAVAAWTGVVVWRNHTPGTSWISAVPTAYRLTVAGVVTFGVGGLLDMAWHQVFGIEVAIDALVSPTHLILGAGGLLILGTGVRSARLSAGRGPIRWTAPAVMSVVLMTALVSFFLIYASAFIRVAPTHSYLPIPEGTPGHDKEELDLIAGLASYLLTTAVLVVPFSFTAVSSQRPPRGIVTLLVGTSAWLCVAMMDFHTVPVSGAAGATAAALLADLALSRLPAAQVRHRLPVVAAGIITLVWVGQTVGMAVARGIGWPPSLWVGAIVLSATAAAAIAWIPLWRLHSATEVQPAQQPPL
ncbi:hypothetical protein [Arthrobacter sp. M4]|uniref:hypothetical protein n=1 Tax=Arthrobacter sp. M4 TaxID=218160 RepID=UPI001CDBE781|nr:hypothetical protein [Arthrobacter sp. M4]MCA4134005.1 hypothetical protein [Arthrobacter sp. M4]